MPKENLFENIGEVEGEIEGEVEGVVEGVVAGGVLCEVLGEVDGEVEGEADVKTEVFRFLYLKKITTPKVKIKSKKKIGKTIEIIFEVLNWFGIEFF